VQDRQYPMEMLTSGLCFNPRFPIRGEYYKWWSLYKRDLSRLW
jgi:hypothetical protein